MSSHLYTFEAQYTGAFLPPKAVLFLSHAWALDLMQGEGTLFNDILHASNALQRSPPPSWKQVDEGNSLDSNVKGSVTLFSKEVQYPEIPSSHNAMPSPIEVQFVKTCSSLNAMPFEFACFKCPMGDSSGDM